MPRCHWAQAWKAAGQDREPDTGLAHPAKGSRGGGAGLPALFSFGASIASRRAGTPAGKRENHETASQDPGSNAVSPSYFLAHAEQNRESWTVVVTASRFSESSLGAAANVLVIGREDIAASWSGHVARCPQECRRRSCAPTGSIGADTAIDMRGFGDGRAAHLVPLNGQRLNPRFRQCRLGAPRTASSASKRRGSGLCSTATMPSVGVINIITDPQDGGSVVVGWEVGMGVNCRANLARRRRISIWPWPPTTRETDGWRRNNAQERNNANGRLGYCFERRSLPGHGDGRNRSRTARRLTQAQYRVNPIRRKPWTSRAERRAGFVRPGFEMARVRPELDPGGRTDAVRNRQRAVDIQFQLFRQPADRYRVFHSPLVLQWRPCLASTTTLGVDYYDGEPDSRQPEHTVRPVNKIVRIDQISRAVYVQNRTELASSVSLTLGGREQTIDQKATDTAGGRISNDHRQTIGEIGLAYRPRNGLRFCPWGSTFRFANLDELTTFAGFCPGETCDRSVAASSIWAASGRCFPYAAGHCLRSENEG